jgi:hypothetical protein
VMFDVLMFILGMFAFAGCLARVVHCHM